MKENEITIRNKWICKLLTKGEQFLEVLNKEREENGKLSKESLELTKKVYSLLENTKLKMGWE